MVRWLGLIGVCNRGEEEDDDDDDLVGVDSALKHEVAAIVAVVVVSVVHITLKKLLIGV